MAYANAQPRKLNPASLTATIVVNGAVFGALLLAAPEITKIPDRIIETYIVPPEAPPPDPIPQPPKPQPDHVSEAVLRNDPIVKTPPLPTFPDIKFSDDPVTGFDPNPGTAERVIEPPTKPAPVMTEAEIDGRYMRDFQPSYPPSKIRLEQEGRVTVRVLVGANGRVLQLQPVGNPDADFLGATRKQALARWRFKPATRDGVPIEAWREISVRFELNT